MANTRDRSDSQHNIAVCTTCRVEGQAGAPGAELVRQLREAITLASRNGQLATFTVSDIACMAGCSRPCTIAFQADDKATYLFGDIDPAHHVDAIVQFAKQYECSADGWTRSAERPSGLAGKTLARVPAITGIANVPAGS